MLGGHAHIEGTHMSLRAFCSYPVLLTEWETNMIKHFNSAVQVYAGCRRMHIFCKCAMRDRRSTNQEPWSISLFLFTITQGTDSNTELKQHQPTTVEVCRIKTVPKSLPVIPKQRIQHEQASVATQVEIKPGTAHREAQAKADHSPSPEAAMKSLSQKSFEVESQAQAGHETLITSTLLNKSPFKNDVATQVQTRSSDGHQSNGQRAANGLQKPPRLVNRLEASIDSVNSPQHAAAAVKPATSQKRSVSVQNLSKDTLSKVNVPPLLQNENKIFTLFQVELVRVTTKVVGLIWVKSRIVKLYQFRDRYNKGKS